MVSSSVFSKELNIDDYVKIGDYKGKILDINLSKVVLQNDDDDILYLPNDKGVSIRNYQLHKEGN